MDKLDKNFPESVDQVLTALGDLLKAKNKDYGNSAFQSPELTPGLPPGMAILVRVCDKYNRLKTLLGSGNTPATNEAIDDTILDLAGYMVLLYIWRSQNQKEL